MKIDKNIDGEQVIIDILLNEDEYISDYKLKEFAKLYSGLKIEWEVEPINFNNGIIYSFYMI